MSNTQRLTALKTLSKGRTPKRQRVSTEEEVARLRGQFQEIDLCLVRNPVPVEPEEVPNES
jgi:hypothetical protein